MKNLITIRCPFKKRGNHDNKLYLCNRTCVRVLAGSSGEAYCKTCRLTFEFTVDSQARENIGIRIEKV